MGLSSKKTKTSSQSTGTATTTPQVPSWISGPYQQFFSQVAGMGNNTAPATPESPLQTQAFSGASGLNSDATRGLVGYNPELLRNADLSPYMNPYTQNVIDTSMADLNRARQMAIGQGQGAATMAGAYGGSRHGVADSLTNERFIDQAGSLAAQLRAAGYGQALDSARFDSQQGLAGANFRLGAANQLEQGERANTLTQAGLGEQQRAVAQENDPIQARLAYMRQIAQLMGISPEAFIGQQINQSGTSSGTQKQSGGFSFGWSPSGGLQVGYG